MNQTKKLKYIFIPQLISDGLFVATLFTAIASIRFDSLLLAVISGLLNTWTAVCGHNFFHQRDNFRMRYFNLSYMSYRDWRITHAMSHHMFPNSLLDVEVMLFEPIFCWTPSDKIKNTFQRYGSWFYAPVIWMNLYPLEFTKR